MKRVLLLGTLLLTPACTQSAQYGTTKTVVVREVVNELEKEPVPGTVDDVWVQPMYDTIRVPSQLDPKGVYYRPSHKTVVEIRPGKFQAVEYPDFRGQYKTPPR